MSRLGPPALICVLVLCMAACSRAETGAVTFEAASSEEIQLALGEQAPVGATTTSTSPVPGFGSVQPQATTGTVPLTVPSTPVDDPVTTPSAPTTSTASAAPETSPSADGAAGTECLSRLSVRQKVGLLVWPAVYTFDWSLAVENVRNVGVGGVVLMKPSDGIDESELASLIRQLDDASALGVLVSTDEEGGSVQRLRALEPLASQSDVAARLEPDSAEQLIATHGALLSRVGIDVVLGPVVDVLPAEGEVSLNSSRFFSPDPFTAAEFGEAYVRGWLDAGLVPVLKHYPGHGGASMDTHEGAATTPGLRDLWQRDLVPYASLSDYSSDIGVMLGHLTVPDLTDGLPASMSPHAVRLLRETLEYDDTLVLTDALEMGAVSMPLEDAAVAAVVAGADVVVFTQSNGAAQVVSALEQAVAMRTLSLDRVDDAAGRVLRHLQERGGGCR